MASLFYGLILPQLFAFVFVSKKCPIIYQLSVTNFITHTIQQNSLLETPLISALCA